MTTSNSTSKRITKSVRFAEIIKVLEAANRPELVAVMEHEVELLTNKNKTKSGEKKLTATQTANRALCAEILNAMEVGAKYTCADIAKLVPSLNEASTSKVSALVRSMRNDIDEKTGLMVGTGELVRTVEKGKTYFSLA